MADLTRLTPQTLAHLAEACLPATIPRPPTPPRLLSIWEITTWVLPMAPEHLRRVLAATPSLPQGSAGTDGGTRWFTNAEVATLRGHFSARARSHRYAPVPTKRAPLITLTGPGGAIGRTTALIHLATAASLAGFRVLVMDGDPSGTLAQTLHCQGPPPTGDVLTLLARSAGHNLRRLNQSRLDRGEAPTPMDPVLSAALSVTTTSLIRPTGWPGLDLLPATATLMQADLALTTWRLAQRSWAPWAALSEAFETDTIRKNYDLILCDTPRGLGPLALALLTATDILLAPLPLRPIGLTDLATGLASIAQATAALEADLQATARALGQTIEPMGWQRLAILPTRAGPDAARHLATAAAQLGTTLLPAALPELPAAQFYDLDYRTFGRLPYAPLRDACDAAWAGLAEAIRSL